MPAAECKRGCGLRTRCPHDLAIVEIISLYVNKKNTSNNEVLGAISTCCWPELGTAKPSRRERGVLPGVWLSPCVTHQELGWVRSTLRNRTCKHMSTTLFMYIELHAPSKFSQMLNLLEKCFSYMLRKCGVDYLQDIVVRISFASFYLCNFFPDGDKGITEPV